MQALKFQPVPDLDFFEVDVPKSVTPAWEALLAYVRARLLRIDADDVRDEISALLVDEQYHELLRRLVDAVLTAKASGDTSEAEAQRKYEVPTSLLKEFSLAKRLQAKLSAVIAEHFIPTDAAEAASLDRRLMGTDGAQRVRGIEEVLQTAAPARLKRAVISHYVAQICNIALSANTDGLGPEAAVAVLLEEYVEALRHQLAFLHARGLGDLDDELVPASYRFDDAEEWQTFHEGMARTAQRLARPKK